MSDNIPAPTIYQLSEELVDVDEWYFLGVVLKIPVSKLKEIQGSSPQAGMRFWRIEMLYHWLQSTPGASWNDIIVALEKIGLHALSTRLREKYHIPSPIPLTGQHDYTIPVTTLATTPATSLATTTPVTSTQVIVPGKYRRDFEDIQNRFAQLFDEVANILTNEESITLESLKGYVSKLSVMRDSLENARTISDIIDVIQEHSSFTCCEYLKGVARRFNVSAVNEKVEEYYNFVDDFCQYKLANHIYMKPFLTAKSTQFTPSTTITFKLRWQPNDRTLSDILELLQQAFDEHSVDVHIVVVRGGSVRVICCAPQYLMTELVRLAQKNRELLVESSVTYLRVGDTIVVDNSDENEISLVEDLVLQLTIALQLKEQDDDVVDRTSGSLIDREGQGHSDAQAPIMSQEFQGSISSPTLSGSSAATEHMKKSMIHCQHTQSGPSRSIWQITLKQAEYILTYKPDGTFLVWEESQEPSYLSSSSINTHVLSYIVNGKIEHVPIYKRGHYYGILGKEKYTSVEQFVAVRSRTGIRFSDNTSVTLTNRLLPDEDTLANLPSDIPTIIQQYTFSDVASLPKHYPHHDESTWLCRLLSKEQSERLLRGRIDETFLVRATDLSGPSHLFNVDIVVKRKVVSLCVYREGDWLRLETWNERYDSINTLVMHSVTTTVPIPIGDHTVLACFQYPVHSSQYYK